LTVLITGCIISINENNYRLLTNKDRPYIRSFHHFGHRIKLNRISLCKDLGLDPAAIPRHGYDDFLFQGNALIFYNNDLKREQLDSLVGKPH